MLKPLAVTLACSFLVIFCFEIYLRETEPRIISNRAENLQRGSASGSGSVADSGAVVVETHRGRRLVPGVDVTIRNHRISHKDVRMRINSHGFRGAEIGPRVAGEKRILVLGDSITWADYLEEDEVYVSRIGHHMRQGSDTTVTMINAGVGDIGIKEEVSILEDRGLALEPDLVLLGFYLNDSRPPLGFAQELHGRGWLRRHSMLAETIYRNIVLAGWIKGRGQGRFDFVPALKTLPWRQDRRAFLHLAELARFDWGAGWAAESWQIVRAHLETLKRLSETHRFKVGIVIFPVAYQVAAEFLERYPQYKMENLAEEFGFPTLDLLPLLRSHQDEKLFFDSCHPVAWVNDLIGREISDWVQSEPMLGMSDPTPPGPVPVSLQSQFGGPFASFPVVANSAAPPPLSRP